LEVIIAELRESRWEMSEAWLDACRAGDASTVRELLLSDGADVVNSRSAQGAHGLLLAAQEGHLDCVRALIGAPGVDVNAATADGGATALFAAASEGHTAVVAALLAHPDLDVNARYHRLSSLPR
jgi:ankyrin repeat protein